MALWPARASAYSALYAFGDSLSDAGNLFVDTGGAYYGPPYYQGHPSNGLTWVEDLSLKLGLGRLTASEAGGNDYAYGFSFTGPALPGHRHPSPTSTSRSRVSPRSPAGTHLPPVSMPYGSAGTTSSRR